MNLRKIIVGMVSLGLIFGMTSFSFAATDDAPAEADSSTESFSDFQKFEGGKDGVALPFSTDYKENLVITMKQANEDVVNWSEYELTEDSKSQHEAYLRDNDGDGSLKKKGIFYYIFGFGSHENTNGQWKNFGEYISINPDNEEDPSRIIVESVKKNKAGEYVADKDKYSHINTVIFNDAEYVNPSEGEDPNEGEEPEDGDNSSTDPDGKDEDEDGDNSSTDSDGEDEDGDNPPVVDPDGKDEDEDGDNSSTDSDGEDEDGDNPPVVDPDDEDNPPIVEPDDNDEEPAVDPAEKPVEPKAAASIYDASPQTGDDFNITMVLAISSLILSVFVLYYTLRRKEK